MHLTRHQRARQCVGHAVGVAAITGEFQRTQVVAAGIHAAGCGQSCKLSIEAEVASAVHIRVLRDGGRGLCDGSETCRKALS